MFIFLRLKSAVKTRTIVPPFTEFEPSDLRTLLIKFAHQCSSFLRKFPYKRPSLWGEGPILMDIYYTIFSRKKNVLCFQLCSHPLTPQRTALCKSVLRALRNTISGRVYACAHVFSAVLRKRGSGTSLYDSFFVHIRPYGFIGLIAFYVNQPGLKMSRFRSLFVKMNTIVSNMFRSETRALISGGGGGGWGCVFIYSCSALIISFEISCF